MHKLVEKLEDLAFLCRTTTLHNECWCINVPLEAWTNLHWRDRTFDEWSMLLLLNDTDFKLRNAFERWQNGINNMSDNEGLTNPVDYQVDAFIDALR